MIKPLETQYKGYRFRSRTEARWAVFFDALCIKWEYEKEGYDLGAAGWYLPDFWLLANDIPEDEYFGSGYFIEIKGQHPTSAEFKRLIELEQQTGHTCICFAGAIGEHETFLIQEGGVTTDDFGGDCNIIFLISNCGITARSPEYKNAIAIARSARFEHGENGARR